MVGKPRVDPSRWPEIVQRYRAGEDCSVLGSAYGVGRDAVYAILRRSGCPVEHRGGAAQTPPETEAEIVRRYVAGEGSTSLAKEFGVTKRTVFNILNRAGVGTRPKGDRVHGETAVRQKQRVAEGHKRGPKLALNEHAFDVLTDDVAYWIGYLMCDGGVLVYEHTGRSPRLSLVQAVKHIDHLKTLSSFLQCGHAISAGSSGGFGPTHSLAVTSGALAGVLARYGIHGLKPTRRAEDQRLLFHPHFWRGCVDADGSLNADGSHLYLSGHRPLLDQWALFMRHLTGESPREYEQPGCFASHCPSVRASRRMSAYLYIENAGVCLPKKLARAKGA